MVSMRGNILSSIFLRGPKSGSQSGMIEENVQINENRKFYYFQIFDSLKFGFCDLVAYIGFGDDYSVHSAYVLQIFHYYRSFSAQAALK